MPTPTDRRTSTPEPIARLMEGASGDVAERRLPGTPGSGPTSSPPATSPTAPPTPSPSFALTLTSGGTLPSEALDPADDVHVLRALAQVSLALGVELSAERRAAVAKALLARGYSRVDLDRAALALSADARLDDKLRYGGALSAADFARAIEGEGSEPGVRLMTREQALADSLRRRIGIENYRPVPVEGRTKPMWTPNWT